jgi:hypothetical protein
MPGQLPIPLAARDHVTEASWLLLLIGLVGTFGAALGDIHVYASVPHYPIASRINAGIFGILALLAGGGCRLRAPFGWYGTVVLIWATVGWDVFRAIYLSITWDLDWLGILLGLLGESTKIGIFLWISIRFWNGQKYYFRMSNQSSDPTLSSGTPAAGQPARHP